MQGEQTYDSGSEGAAPAPIDTKGPAKSGSKKNIAIAASIVLIILAAIGGVMLMNVNGNANTSTGQATAATAEAGGTRVLLKTTMGDVTLQLYPDMPITAGNFEKLVKQGFYDGTIFHRVIEGFMIQGGDPTGTGRGGPGYVIEDEFTNSNRNDRGTISMANAGPNTGGSQFFINVVDNNFLDTKHPVFGRVVVGMDVVDAIVSVTTDSADRPLTEVKIIKATVI
jgi:peptidylprolyl isomerase